MDIMKNILSSYGELQISPKGSDMHPYLREKRDKVRVIPCPDKLNMYDIVLHKSHGLYIFHRIVEEADGGYMICGDNTPAVERIEKNDLIGVVSGITRGGRGEISPDGFGARLWIKFWYQLNFKNCFLKVKSIFKRFIRNNDKNT